MSTQFVCDMCHQVIGFESIWQFAATYGEMAIQVDLCRECGEEVEKWLKDKFGGDSDD